MSNRIRLALAASIALATVLTMGLAASPASAQDRRPCVSKREFNSLSQQESKAEIEERWDVTGLGTRAQDPVWGSIVIYPRCAFALDRAWYGVHYAYGHQTHRLWSVGVGWWRAYGAKPHGRP